MFQHILTCSNTYAVSQLSSKANKFPIVNFTTFSNTCAAAFRRKRQGFNCCSTNENPNVAEMDRSNSSQQSSNDLLSLGSLSNSLPNSLPSSLPTSSAPSSIKGKLKFIRNAGTNG